MCVLYCFKCHSEVVFDAEHIGKNGKKIPLDPTTRRPHDCPERESPKSTVITAGRVYTQEDKDDHGNEDVFSSKLYKVQEPANIDNSKTQEIKGYVDHTVKGQSKVKSFSASTTDLLDIMVNDFLKTIGDRFRGGQFHPTNEGFAIALYYEEMK
jgi:hypothetical protein